MIPSLNSVTSVKHSEDTAYSEKDRREDEGSEDLSNAELYLKRSKKRGLYVETENTETSATGTNVTQHLKRLLPSKPQPQRFLPRDLSPLPGRSDSKPFIWSVLDDSTPATSESDIHEANKQIRNTIQEIKEAIKDINIGSTKKPKEDAAKKKSKETAAKKAEVASDVNLDARSRDTHKSRSEKSRCSNAKEILEIRKKELTLTLRTVTKDPPTNRFSYRFVHEEDNSTITETNQVKIRKGTPSNDTNRPEAKRRASSKKIPDPIQINYDDIDTNKKTDNKAKSKYVNDLNSNRESMFHFLGSDAGSKKGNEKPRNISSYINDQQSSSKNIVVIQPNKELNITSQSQISDSEELEVLDIDLITTSNDTMSCTKTLMGNNFYTNNNDRSKVLRKQDTNTYSSDDNEVFGIYSNYNEDEETVKSVGSLEVPFLYDSVDDINRKEHSYELARYLLDEKQTSNADYSGDERRRIDDYPRRIYQKRVHIAPKTITPATTNYPRRNKKQRRTMKSFANAEKRRKFIEKEKLINLIKQQLSMDYINMEPPRSVFEELKEMARNKRRRNKRVSFSNDIELYERRLRKPEKRSQIKQRHVKRFKKNPQSIIRQNTEIYKDIEFFNKVSAMNKRSGNLKTKIMSPGYVNRKINEIQEELSDNEEDVGSDVDEDASLEVINM